MSRQSTRTHSPFFSSLLAAWAVAVLAFVALPPRLLAAAPARPGLQICVAADAPEPVRKAAESLLAAAAAKTQSLLAVFCAGRDAPTQLTDSRALLAANRPARAYDHLILVGLSDDPLLQAASEREARAEEGELYVFGFGHLAGDVGYVESGRNPFLHARGIPAAPYETEVITITGTTPVGVASAPTAKASADRASAGRP